jgi:hypothetical protein
MGNLMTRTYPQRQIDPFTANCADVRTGKLWDEITILPGEELSCIRRRFFTLPIGAVNVDGSIKGPIQTNMQMGSLLPPPRCFETHRIVFTFTKRCDPRDVVLAFESLVFQFYVGDKRFDSALLCHMQTVKEPLSPIRICDFCKSVYVDCLQCPGCGARSFRLSSLGEMDSGQQFAMDITPLYIPPLVRFYVDVLARPGLSFRAPLTIWCTLEGREGLAVQ